MWRPASWLVLIAAFAVSACDVPVPGGAAPSGPREAPVVGDADAAARSFVRVARQMEPVVEADCRRRAPSLNCDFLILVDDRRGQPANAFQTLDDDGRPLIVFTLQLIREAANEDELALVLGHEAAHHIRNHLARQRETSELGAVVLGGLAAALGGNGSSVESAARVGATIGARSYSKEFELEADQLGTILTARAGYDPVRGAQFFNRIPDPGDRFLGTHPPNDDRIEIVERTAAGL